MFSVLFLLLLFCQQKDLQFFLHFSFVWLQTSGYTIKTHVVLQKIHALLKISTKSLGVFEEKL